MYTLYFYYKNIEIIHELFHSAPTIKKYYQSLTGTFNATKSTMTEDTENWKQERLLAVRRYLKPRSLLQECDFTDDSNTNISWI